MRKAPWCDDALQRLNSRISCQFCRERLNPEWNTHAPPSKFAVFFATNRQFRGICIAVFTRRITEFSSNKAQKLMTPSSFKQRTLRRPESCEGVGLHSGAKLLLRLLPAPAGSGITFVRTDLANQPCVKALAKNVVDTSLATTLADGPARVATVEHLLAALFGLGIDNARIEINGPEVPIMDGSAAPFAALVSSAGIREQDAPKSFLVIRQTVEVREGDKFARFEPASRFGIDVTIDFRHPLIHDQSYELEFSDKTFTKEIARARTFGFLRDVERLQAAGLAKGGSLENAIVVDDFNVLNPEGLRFSDEFVRHKILDALGDVSLVGLPVLGKMTAYKTGHALNHRLVTEVLSNPANCSVVTARASDVRRENLDMADLQGVLAPFAT